MKQLETTILYTVDADDFCESNSNLEILERIHAKNPAFKITLFTIVGRCSDHWLKKIKGIEWIQMVPHGFMHNSNRECQWWSYEESINYLDLISKLELVKGFKAPGWQISDGMYQALLEKGYWVADQHYNDKRRPKGLKVFYPTDQHYHIGHLGGHNANAIEYFEKQLAELKGDFNFIGL